MLINRNNYEDFFLLYADGELRADERKAVEDFIAENEDLRIELDLIKATVLPAEEILFADKSFLYKEIIFDSSFQEKLLLKLDDELAVKELESVNALLATNVDVTREYGILLKTKLDANEIIVFEHKHLLYKKERDNVVVFRFARWAAAAILIGFALFFGEKVFNKKSNIVSELAIEPKIKNKKTIATANNDVDNEMAKQPENEIVNEELAVVEEMDSDRKQSNNHKNVVAIHNKISPVNLLVSKEKNKIEKQEQLVLVKKMQSTLAVPERIEIALSNQQIASIKNIEKPKLAVVDDNIVPLENTYKQALAITEIEKSENKILYMDEDDIKRSKAGGFFRKVKRFVERTANIKAGNSLQIAGFEIAAK